MGLFLIVFILMNVSLSVFWLPLIVLVVVGGLCRERPVVRNACIIGSVLILLVAIPAAAIHVVFVPTGDERLATYFGDVIEGNHVARYRFGLVALGETEDYWKLKNVDPNSCRRIIEEHGLEMIPADKPYSPQSRRGAPWWWPKSVKGY